MEQIIQKAEEELQELLKQQAIQCVNIQTAQGQLQNLLKQQKELEQELQLTISENRLFNEEKKNGWQFDMMVKKLDEVQELNDIQYARKKEEISFLQQFRNKEYSRMDELKKLDLTNCFEYKNLMRKKCLYDKRQSEIHGYEHFFYILQRDEKKYPTSRFAACKLLHIHGIYSEELIFKETKELLYIYNLVHPNRKEFIKNTGGVCVEDDRVIFIKSEIISLGDYVTLTGN